MSSYTGGTGTGTGAGSRIALSARAAAPRHSLADQTARPVVATVTYIEHNGTLHTATNSLGTYTFTYDAGLSDSPSTPSHY